MAKKSGAAIAAKMCIRCSRILPLTSFPKNKEWRTQSYHDVWCLECCGKYLKTREDAKQYCWDNNRRWSEGLWNAAAKKATYLLNKNPDFLTLPPGEERDKLEEEATAKCLVSTMNLPALYFYEPHDAVMEAPPEKIGTVAPGAKGEDDASPEEEEVYSREWGGKFTKEDLEVLDMKLAGIRESHDLSDPVQEDYARKVAKASLDADKAGDRMRRGDALPKEYADMMNIYDTLSKSANFAACRKEPGDQTGMGSLGEILLKLEVNKKLEIPPVTFPKDDVDKVLDDYRHLAVAVGAEAMG